MNAETTNTATTVTIRCKAFSYEGVRENRVMIDGDKALVWDSVAGYFTTCHVLAPSALKRARKLAQA